MRIEGKVALVTGGASGLGAASARELVKKGAFVLVSDLNEELGKDVAKELGPNAQFIQTDVSEEKAVRAAVQLAQERMGGLHIAVNCAGTLVAEKVVGKNGPHDLSRFKRVVDTNLVGTFNVLRMVAAVMQGNDPDSGGERGIIVNTASIAAFEGQIGQSAYAASKAGIVGLTLPAARELAKDGIRVCAIAPGVFDTAMLAGLPDAVRQSLGAQVPFPPRLGYPQEFALLVLHIIENPMLNGETIRLDGALRMTAR